MLDVESFMSSFYKGTAKTDLKSIKFFTEKFSHPEKKYKIIHIAGTNGKGSCVEIMTNILIKAGYTVGKFLSPHLIKYNERISVNNEEITDADMERLIDKVKCALYEYYILGDNKVSVFEIETIMAFLYFEEKQCDFVVLETGLGGISDATNVVEPILSIITSIGYDHMKILGNTLEEIATQKAGIIKQNSDTIFVKQEKEVNEVIEKTSKEKNNKLHLIEPESISNYSYDENFQKIDFGKYKGLEINLKGKKQILNASICVEATEVLKSKSINIKEKAVREGLKTVVHRGRFETISENPLIIFDGAHNKPAIENFVNSVEMYYKQNKKLYIVSILKSKDYDSMIKTLVKDEKGVFIFTSGNNEDKFVNGEELLKTAQKYTKNKNLFVSNIEDAIDNSWKNYRDFVTFVVGSFYVYGTVKHYCDFLFT